MSKIMYYSQTTHQYWSIHKRFLCSLLFTLTLSTFAQTPEAEAGIVHPLKRGLVGGGVTALSVAGAGALGVAGGNLLGDGGFSSLGYSVLGGTIAAAVNGPLGARWISDYAGADKGVITRNTAIVTALGAVSAVTGMLAINVGLEMQTSLIFAGMGTVLVAAPLTASVSAGLVPVDNLSTLAPVITPTLVVWHSILAFKL